MLEMSGNYASDNRLLYEWTGTHWKTIDDAMGERMALKWIASDGCGPINAANARAAYQTAVRWLPMLCHAYLLDEFRPGCNFYLNIR